MHSESESHAEATQAVTHESMAIPSWGRFQNMLPFLQDMLHTCAQDARLRGATDMRRAAAAMFISSCMATTDAQIKRHASDEGVYRASGYMEGSTV